MEVCAAIRSAPVFSARAVLTYEDGSRIELGGNSSVTLEENDGLNMGSLLNIGTLRAYVKKLIARRFQVHRLRRSAASAARSSASRVMGGGAPWKSTLYKACSASRTIAASRSCSIPMSA